MTPKALIKTNNESGNILVYILGAIFLLGMLVVMVKGSSTPGSGIDQEQLMIRVNEIQQYGNELERGIAYILRNGHSEADIRFAHPDASSAYGDITDTPSRQLFDRQGGAATYRPPPNGIQTTATDWLFTGANRVGDVGTNAASATSADLIALLQNVTQGFCLRMNEKNSITNPSDAPPQDEDDAEIATPFVGTFANTQLIEDSGAIYLSTKLEGCFEGDNDPASGTYHYYRVLLPR